MNVTAERTNRSYYIEILSPQIFSWTRNRTQNLVTLDSLRHSKVMLRADPFTLKLILDRLTTCPLNNATVKTITKKAIFGHLASFCMKWHSSVRLSWPLISSPLLWRLKKETFNAYLRDIVRSWCVWSDGCLKLIQLTVRTLKIFWIYHMSACDSGRGLWNVICSTWKGKRRK